MEEIYPKNLTGKERRVIEACMWMVENEATIQKTAEHFNYATTTFWRRIHKECRILRPDLYEQVCQQMEVNLERSRSNWRVKK